MKGLGIGSGFLEITAAHEKRKFKSARGHK